MPMPPFTATEIVLPGVVGPEGVIVRQRQITEPDATLRTAIIRVLATGVSDAENAMCRGHYPGAPDFPFVPGFDLVGEVMAVSAVEDEMLVGRRVAAVTRTGAWASYVELDARDILTAPSDLAPETVEAVLLDGITAWQVLKVSPLSGAGATVLVLGADEGVGGLLVQMVQRRGARVVGTGSAPSHAWLREQGAEVVEREDPQLWARLAALAPEGYSVVFDATDGRSLARSFSLLAPGGTIVGYGTGRLRDEHATRVIARIRVFGRFARWRLIPRGGRRARHHNFWAGRGLAPTRFYERLQEDLDGVLALVRSGELAVRIAERLPLERAGDALALADTGSPPGKIILLPSAA